MVVVVFLVMMLVMVIINDKRIKSYLLIPYSRLLIQYEINNCYIFLIHSDKE